MRRGDIYYITRRDTIGAEIAKGRPGIIVSCDSLNAAAEVVEVVYLTTQPRKELPTHVTITSSGITSTALCEQIDTVSKILVANYCGRCTPSEMDAINEAILRSLGIELEDVEDEGAVREKTAFEEEMEEELEQVKAERDRYAKMVDLLMEGKA